MKKILVVDNDVAMLSLVDLMLTHHDYIVKTTSRWQIISKTIKTPSISFIILAVSFNATIIF